MGTLRYKLVYDGPTIDPFGSDSQLTGSSVFQCTLPSPYTMATCNGGWIATECFGGLGREGWGGVYKDLEVSSCDGRGTQEHMWPV